MEFANKEYLLLLLLLIPYLVWYFSFRKRTEATMTLSDTWLLLDAPKTLRQRLTWLPMALRCITLVLVVIVLCRPQTRNAWDEQSVEGIDIMLAMDVSTSMLAEDLKPNRMEAAKNVASAFISARPNDNIGLTIFAGEAFTQCPKPSSECTCRYRWSSSDRRRYCCWYGTCQCHNTSEGLKGKVEGSHPAH